MRLKNSVILLVDDEPTNLGVIGQMLRQQGAEVLIATTGSVALERTQQIKPHLILLDVMMPGIDGFETCKRLKANQATSKIPVIFLTALDETHKEEAFKVGAVDFVTKPVHRETLLARVQIHIQLVKMQQYAPKQIDENALVSHDSNTLLLSAVQNGDLSLLKTCLINGANINYVDQEGKTPLIWSAYFRHIDAMAYLLESGADTQVIDHEGFSARDWLELAISFGHKSALQGLLLLDMGV